MVDAGPEQFAGSRFIFVVPEKIQDAIKFLYFFLDPPDFNEYGLNSQRRRVHGREDLALRVFIRSSRFSPLWTSNEDLSSTGIADEIRLPVLIGSSVELLAAQEARNVSHIVL
jgi:hypothetical protein